MAVLSEEATKPVAAGVRCEQLLYTWAPRTLTTPSGGFGVVAHSPGWPAELMEGYYSFLPQGASTLARRHSVPVCLARHETPHGVLVLLKTYLGEDGMGRRGNYLVHAALDPTGSLTAPQALALWRSSALHREAGAVEVTRALPPLCLPTEEPEPEPLRPGEEALLTQLVTALLSHPRTGMPAALEVSQEAAVRLLGHALDALPRPYADHVTFSTYERDLGRSAAQLTVVERPFLERAVPASVPTLGPRCGDVPGAEPGEQQAAAALVQLHLAGEPHLPSLASARSLGEVQQGLRLHRAARQPVARLSGAQLTALARESEDWLLRNVAELVELGRTERLPRVVVTALAHSVQRIPDGTQLVERLIADEVETQLLVGRPSAAASLLEELAVPEEELRSRVVGLATERLAEGRLDPAVLARIAPEVEHAAARLDEAERQMWVAVPAVTHVAAQRWSDLSASLLRVFLTGEDYTDEMVEAVARLMVRDPDPTAALVESLLRSEPLPRLAWRLMVASQLGAVEVLMRCTLPAGALLRDVVPLLPSQEAREECLRLHWRGLAAQAGIPSEIARLLSPPEQPEEERDDRRGGWRRRQRR